MLIDPRDQKPPVHQNDEDPAAEFLEQWLSIREAQGYTREAAIAELNAVGAALLDVEL